MTSKQQSGRAPNGASSIYQGKDDRWHGRVTMGVRDDGKPDRRHVQRKTRAEVTRTFRKLEKQRDSGRVRKAGRAWTVEQWLTHWLDNIAAHSVRYKTLVGYRTDITRHLVPGLGAHRINKLEPEHIEKLYGRMIRSGLAAGTVHHAHRTLRASLSEAVKRKHVALNVAMVAKPPRLDDEEIEPLTVEEARRLLAVASKHTANAARWAVALTLGLRQGEALGLRWPRSTSPHASSVSARPTAPDLATRLQRPPPVRRALPQDDPVQDRVPAAQTHLSTTVSTRLHRPRPLVPPTPRWRPGPR